MALLLSFAVGFLSQSRNNLPITWRMPATPWICYDIVMLDKFPTSPVTHWHCIQYGAEWGRRVTWCLAGAISFALALAEFSAPGDFVRHFVGFLLVWFCGCIFGGIFGMVLGALTGYLIFAALRWLRWRHARQGWFVGLLTCTGVCMCMWIVMLVLSSQWSCTTAQCSQRSLTVLTIVFYPGMIYILTGALLSQHIYARMHTLERQTA